MTFDKKDYVQITSIFPLLVGGFVAVLVLFFNGCKSSQEALSVVLKDSSITVYPGVVRTQDGITYDRGTAKAVQDQLQTITNVDVTLSNAEIDMEGTLSKNSFQYSIFQSSLKRFGDYAKEQLLATDYGVVTDYLITKTPDGGYAAGGIHCYLVNQNGEKEYALLLNSHHDIFKQGNLKANGQTPDDLQHVIDGCKNVLLNAVELDR